MKVFEPNEYPIEFEKEELESIYKTNNILKNIIKEMNAKKADTLEGGYEECPSYFPIDSIKNIVSILSNFYDETPHKMY